VKNLLLVLISIASLSFLSCSGGTTTPGNYNIIGSWKYVSEGGTITITRTFNEDSAYLYIAVNNTNPSLNVTSIGNFETDGTTVTITTSNGNTINKGTYSSTDHKLTLTMDGENGPTVYIKQ
jgi:hypothetical protein